MCTEQLFHICYYMIFLGKVFSFPLEKLVLDICLQMLIVLKQGTTVCVTRLKNVNGKAFPLISIVTNLTTPSLQVFAFICKTSGYICLPGLGNDGKEPSQLAQRGDSRRKGFYLEFRRGIWGREEKPEHWTELLRAPDWHCDQNATLYLSLTQQDTVSKSKKN